jgi:conjugal transfer ATP-binding protein TraC
MASPSKAMSDLEKSYIERAIKEVWEEKGRNTEIDDVVRKLETMEDPYHRAEDIARMLYPFSRSGQYGKFFQGRANITFEKSLTVIELEELKGKKELQSVVLLLMIYHIGRTMYLGERGRKKLAVIDEAWDLLGGQATADFISHGYRRARKYNGAFISITQSLLDFYRAGSVGEAIIENSAWMLMLRQKGESLEEIKKGKKLLLSGYFEELVESLTTVPGKYSEVFIYGGEQGMGLGRFIVDPFSYWLYTTKADEVALLSRFIKEGLSLESAIEKCIELSK